MRLPSLAGHRVGITADRRAEEQGELLRRMGAEVLHGPVLRTLPLGDEGPMRQATEALLATPPTITILSTGIGLRSWVGAAETWGLADSLIDVLSDTRVLARGPKAYAAAAQLGLPVWHQEPSERLNALVEHLSRTSLEGERIALQLHGNETPDIVHTLEAAGADVISVAAYQWVPPEDEGPARRLVREAIDGQLTVVTFTSPSAIESTCRIAAGEGMLDALLDAFRTRVAVACVGPVTRDSAAEHGITVACAPPMGRLGLLVRSIAGTLHDQHLHLTTPSGELVLQGRLLVGEDVELVLADRERQVLLVLARKAGLVVPRSAIERAVWQSTDEDRALDAVLSRMRRRLAPTGLEIATRLRRGYQLLAEPVPCRAVEALLDDAVPAAS